MKPFKLMNSLFAHESDVKNLCATNDIGGFVSVSRDLTTKLWQLTGNNPNTNMYNLVQDIQCHTRYVNAVAVVYTLEGYSNGIIVTGSTDSSIAFHDIESNKLLCQITEHSSTVCTLFFDNNYSNNLLFSGSFDTTAKVWNLNDLIKSDFKLKSSATFKGHQQAVWDVLALHDFKSLLTASADKSIIQWSLDTNEPAFKYTGHTDCVRGLTRHQNNKNEFFSCANDGDVLQWRLMESKPLRKIQVSDSYIYSINGLIQNDVNDDAFTFFITCGEDRSVRIHKIPNKDSEPTNSCVQTLTLPW
jgi:WD40 repeat protein